MTTSKEHKKKWWKEANILIGIIGLGATISVGLVTYWLTAGSVSREYQERIKAARNDVSSSISRSIGEGVVPSKEKIQSVINSIRRQYRIKEEDFETPDTVIDDILASVLANEFLDAKRREELSSKLLSVKRESLSGTDKLRSTASSKLSAKDATTGFVIAIFASLLAAMSLMLIGNKFKRIGASNMRAQKYSVLRLKNFELLFRQLIISFVALTTIVLLIRLFYTTVIKNTHFIGFLMK